MSTEENKALYRRLLEGVMNQRNLALVDELCAPDFVLHRGSTTMQGREPYKQFLSMYLGGGPDFHLTIEDQIAEGDKVVSRFTGRGTHLGPFMGIPPTGKQVTATGIGIIDPQTGEVAPVGERGELCARGLLVMVGYYKMPEKTAETIDKDGWLHTGDLATMNAQGYINIVGRIKDMVIPKAGEQLTEQELREYCQGQISHQKIPSYIQFVESYPLTASGKVQKFVLREQAIKRLGLEEVAKTKTA